MTGYTLLDHTSEIGFEATGESLAEAFEQAGMAVFQIMTDVADLQEEETVAFTVESETLESLFFDYVDELIYLSQAEGLLLRRFTIDVTETEDGYRLTGQARGQEIGENLRLQEIKAPTYSDILVEEDDGWRLRMVVDV